MNPVSPIGAMLGNFKLKVGYDDQFYETSYITDFTGQRIEFVKPEGLLTLSFTPSSITLYPGTYASTQACISPKSSFMKDVSFTISSNQVISANKEQFTAVTGDEKVCFKIGAGMDISPGTYYL